MKALKLIYLNLFFLCFLVLNQFSSKAQDSYSIGFSNRIETKFKVEDVFKIKNLPAYKVLNYNYFSVSLSKKNNRILNDFELNYTNKILQLNNYRQISLVSGSHGSILETEAKFTNCNLQFSYLGLKYNRSYVLIDKKRFNFFIGGFLQFDFLISEKESNHYDSTLYKFESNTPYFSPTTNQVENSYYTKSSTTINFDEFDMISLNSIYFSSGVMFKARFILNKVTVEPTYSIGYNMKSRSYMNKVTNFSIDDLYYLDYPTYTKHQLFNEFGIKVSYLWNT